ncbi:serine/threonine protein kinase [Calothrix sp. PCC 7716]|nr:serine/threonine protein kinase [Calothrix sp. PCC 7716]
MPLILDGRFLPLQLLIPDGQRGGFGRTFLAQDLSFPHRPLRVVKQLHPLIPGGRSSLTSQELNTIELMFQREANVLLSLNHPQIPRAWGFFVVEAPRHSQEQSTPDTRHRQKFFYLTQDYIEGQNLAQELQQNGQFSGREIVNILQQILSILNYIHNEGAIHRDIKPSNIMRCNNGSDNGKLYLIDFGAVKQVSVAGVPTEQSCILGTPDYAPPEQFSGRAVSASSDLYSLAATCVCLLTNRSAGELRSGNSWNWRQYAGVNENLARILDRMLFHYPEQRYQSAQDVKNELDALSSVPVTVPPLPDVTPPTIPTPTPFPDAENSPSQQPKKPDQRGKFRNMLRFTHTQVGLILLGTFVALAIIFYHFWPRPEPTVFSCIDDSLFSCGERRLIELQLEDKVKKEVEAKAKQKGKTVFEEFDAGNRAFRTGDWGKAEGHFKKQLDIYRNDPEARIYLNNTKAARNGNFVKIAVCVPNPGIAEQILRGVAIVQEEINADPSKLKQKMLFIQICNDGNTDSQAKQVAEQLIKHRQDKHITGVIGHYTSNTTKVAGDIYEREKLVVISPTSTAVRDSNYQLSNYVFRVSPDTLLSAKKLVDYIAYIQEQASSQFRPAKVAILYKANPHDSDYYNMSLHKDFKAEVSRRQERGQKIEIIYECNLITPENNIPQCMNQANSRNANIMLLAISNDVVENGNNALDIFTNRGNMILLAGNAVYSLKGRLTSLVDQLIIAVQWVRSENPDQLSELEKQANNIFGEPNKGILINFRTAMAYDAIQAMAQGIRNIHGDITPQKLFDELKNNVNSFSAVGANNVDVKFNQKGDRKIDESNEKQLMFLVTPKQNLTSNSEEPQFKKLNID